MNASPHDLGNLRDEIIARKFLIDCSKSIVIQGYVALCVAVAVFIRRQVSPPSTGNLSDGSRWYWFRQTCSC